MSLSKRKTKNIIMSRFTPFHEAAQYFVEKYFHEVYPGSPEIETKAETPPATTLQKNTDIKKIPRFFHGGVHASCTVMAADLLIVMIKKHFIHHEVLLKEYNADPELQELFRYGVFFHDIGNRQECDKATEAHAQIFLHEMTGMGFSAQKIERILDVMREKDNEQNMDILRIILHDADVLEYNRVLNKIEHFDNNKLALFFLANNIKTRKKNDQLFRVIHKEIFSEELNNISYYYFGLAHCLNHNLELHYRCEMAINCYLETERAIQAFRLWSELQPDNKLDFRLPIELDEYFSVPDFKIPLIELYTKQDRGSFLTKLLKWLSRNEPTKSIEEDPVLQRYESGYLYVRNYHKTSHKEHVLDSESYFLKHNERHLKAAKVTTVEELKNHINNKTLPSFLTLPATLIRQGLSINLYDPNSLAIILDPDKVMATHFFKDNVESYDLHKPNFSFTRPNHVKSLPDVETLNLKLEEREARKKGLAPDNYLRHFGNTSTHHNEVWLSYQFDAAMGIVITKEERTVKLALALRFKIYQKTGNLVRFYYYDPTMGLHRVSEREVLSHARELPNPDYDFSWWCDSLIRAKGISHGYEVTITPQGVSYEDKHNELAFIERFAHIQCSLHHTAASPETPITYTMMAHHANGDIIPAKAYYLDQLPVIELQGKINKILIDNRGLFRKIIHEYQNLMVWECNLLFERLSAQLQRIYGISSIGLTTVSETKKGKNKHSLILSFICRPKQEASHQDIANMVETILDLPFRLKEDDVEFPRHSFYITLRQNQCLDFILRRLLALVNGNANTFQNPSSFIRKLYSEDPFEALLQDIYANNIQAREAKFRELRKYITAEGGGKQDQVNRLMESLIDKHLFMSHFERVFLQLPEIKTFNCSHKYGTVLVDLFKRGNNSQTSMERLLQLHEGDAIEVDPYQAAELLLQIAITNNTTLMQTLLKKTDFFGGTDVSSDPDTDNQPLHYAAEHNNPELFRLILTRETCYPIRNKKGFFPLDYWLHPDYINEATIAGLRVALDFLNLPDLEEYSDLMTDIIIAHAHQLPPAILASLLNKKKDTYRELNLAGEDLLESPYALPYIILHAMGNISQDLFLKCAVDTLNSKDLGRLGLLHYTMADGRSALHFTLQKPNPSLQLFKLLLERGFYFECEDNQGNSVIDLVNDWARNGRTDFRDALYEKFPEMAKSAKRKTPDEGDLPLKKNQDALNKMVKLSPPPTFFGVKSVNSTSAPFPRRRESIPEMKTRFK